MYNLTKRQVALYMKVRKVIFSCNNMDQINTAANMLGRLRKNLARTTLKSFLYGNQSEKACDSLCEYLKRRRDEIKYSLDQYRKPPTTQYHT